MKVSAGSAYIRSFSRFMMAALAFSVLAGFAVAQETAERVQHSKVLRVGLEGTYPPFNFVDSSNNMVGFDVDISNEIASRLGVTTEFFGTGWSSLIGGLQSDKFDVIIAQMSITEERAQSVDFTVPYVVSGAVLISRDNDDRFAELQDISGHKVGVGIGTTFETVARTVEGADVRTYDSFQAYAQELATGRVDVILNDQLTAGYNIKELKLPLKITSSILSEDNIAIAVKKGNADFVAELDQIMTDMIADGTYREIFFNWFATEPALQ